MHLLEHLHFELNEDNLPFTIEKLLQLTFTPSIKRFTGSVKADKFFDTLFGIVDQSPASFDQLEEMTEYTGANQGISDQRRVKFPSIVRAFDLRVVAIDAPTDTVHWSNHFFTFRNLTTFTLKGIPTGLDGIEYQIKGCHYLKTLNLQDIDYGGQTMARMTTEEVTNWWTASNAIKEELFITLNIEALCRPELIEYLTFKYPNVANITIKGRLWFPSNDLEVAQGNLKRILDAVKGLRRKKLELILPPTITITNIIRVLSNTDVITLASKQIDGQNQLEMKIN
ncbi:hypothetical protein V8B55DRAFT_1068905 [Mucor lusitanicus]|uniref:Uncharacterized protein n=2 Tax=Mucor circinelloides f. lusitanicus TaxID=29924 RepID=A0A162MRQ8_MUCCL|nr:hypothetical protein FB192DRAFT_1468574 [Mucor lusitanicus]OAD04685.1 hypothetical protein MUCCIDRAFT_79787 [Mucor lusitanicus CBS 277.49]